MRFGTVPIPQDAPNWLSNTIGNLQDWVFALRAGPQPMTAYTVAQRPDASKNWRTLIYDGTNNVPAFADVSGNWNDLLASGGPVSASTLSITQGAVISGTYLPILTAVTNVAATTAYNAQYMRVGNVVNVSGKLDVDPTLTGATQVGISLPIASVLSAAEKCSGTAASNSVVSEVAAIDGDTANNRAQMDWITTSLANHTMYFSFQYLVT